MPNKKPVTINEEVPGKKPGTVNEGVPGYRTYEGPLLRGSKITFAELELDSRYREFLQNKTVHIVKGSFPPRVLAAEVDELRKGTRLQNNDRLPVGPGTWRQT